MANQIWNIALSNCNNRLNTFNNHLQVNLSFLHNDTANKVVVRCITFLPLKYFILITTPLKQIL